MGKTRKKRAGRKANPYKKAKHLYGCLPLPMDPEFVNKIEGLFNKKFTYPSTENTDVICPDWQQSAEPHWQDPELQELKVLLNSTKAKLSSIDINKWHRHTSLLHPGGLVMHHMRRHLDAEMCTQAWCKFREIIGTFGLSESCTDLSSLHLCEGPGGFICSLNHYLKNTVTDADFSWEWMAMTLNPYYEGNTVSSMIDDDQLISKTPDHWYFGCDDTGDVMQSRSVLGLMELGKQQRNTFSMVTADGSIDCANTPGEQEQVTAHLHYCEVVTALHVLTPGGQLVLKMFTLLESFSVGLMYLLHQTFEQVNVFKPVTSKPGNSEVYVVARGYKALPQGILDKLRARMDCPDTDKVPLYTQNAIATDFLEAHRACCRLFTQAQVDTITQNLELFEQETQVLVNHVKKLQQACVSEFVRRFMLQPLDPADRVVPVKSEESEDTTKVEDPHRYIFFRHSGTYTERQMSLGAEWKDRVTGMKEIDCPTYSAPWLNVSESLGEDDISKWSVTLGKAFPRVLSSRFCNKYLLYQLNDFLQQKQCGSNDDTNSYQTFVMNSVHSMVERLCQDLGRTQRYQVVRNETDGILQAAMETAINGSVQETDDVTSVVPLTCIDEYISVCDGDQENKWLRSLNTLKQLLICIHVLEEGSTLVLTMAPLLTRVNAGIVAALQICFSKVTIVIPPQLSHPVCFLVAVGFKSLSGLFKTYLQSIAENIPEEKNHQTLSNAENCQDKPLPDNHLLAFVPMRRLYDPQLNEMLWNTNNTMLAGRLNYLIQVEKRYFGDNNKELNSHGSQLGTDV